MAGCGGAMGIDMIMHNTRMGITGIRLAGRNGVVGVGHGHGLLVPISSGSLDRFGRQIWASIHLQYIPYRHNSKKSKLLEREMSKKWSKENSETVIYGCWPGLIVIFDLESSRIRKGVGNLLLPRAPG